MRKHWFSLAASEARLACPFVALLRSALLLPCCSRAPWPSRAARGARRASSARATACALPGVAVVARRPGRRARASPPGPTGRFRAHRARGRRATPRPSTRPASSCATAPTVAVGAGESRARPRARPRARVRARGGERHARRGHAVDPRRRASTCSTAQRIDDRAAPSLLPLLQDVPGVATARTGQTGLQGSVFIRGGESRYACVLVDGVPVNQPGGAFDFGTALPFELERVEVVRGAASSLYGNDALAGVVSLQTRRARPGERPSLRAEGEAGSFDWQRWLGATSGARGAFDWNAGVQRLDHRQRGAEQPLRADGGRALRRGDARLAHGRARGRALRRQHHRDAGADRVRPARPGRVLRARGPRRLRLGAPRRGPRLSQQLSARLRDARTSSR